MNFMVDFFVLNELDELIIILSGSSIALSIFYENTFQQHTETINTIWNIIEFIWLESKLFLHERSENYKSRREKILSGLEIDVYLLSKCRSDRADLIHLY